MAVFSGEYVGRDLGTVGVLNIHNGLHNVVNDVVPFQKKRPLHASVSCGRRTVTKTHQLGWIQNAVTYWGDCITFHQSTHTVFAHIQYASFELENKPSPLTNNSYTQLNIPEYIIDVNTRVRINFRNFLLRTIVGINVAVTVGRQ